MKRVIKVAAVQMEIKPLNIKVNLKRAKSLIEQIFKQGPCDLIVFPEDFITGPIPYNLELTQDENSESIQMFKNLAKQYKTYIVCGSVVKKNGSNYFNTSFLINDKGRIILEYRKNNLWLPERRYLTKDNQIIVAQTPIGKIGIIICWDLVFPAITQKLARLGVDIICCPSYWTIEDAKPLNKKYGQLTQSNFVNTLCPARAMETEALLIYANGGGIARVPLKSKMWKAPQIGQTQICAPVLGTVAKINDNSEGFIIYEYDSQIAIDSEKNYQIRNDLNYFPL